MKQFPICPEWEPAKCDPSDTYPNTDKHSNIIRFYRRAAGDYVNRGWFIDAIDNEYTYAVVRDYGGWVLVRKPTKPPEPVGDATTISSTATLLNETPTKPAPAGDTIESGIITYDPDDTDDDGDDDLDLDEEE